MLFTYFRAANAVFAVVVAILVSRKFGDTSTAKLLTVLITASVVAFSEWLMILAPKHFARARRILDPRSVFVGVWLQDVKAVFGKEGKVSDAANQFAVFIVEYKKDVDNYKIEGYAYTGAGSEHARWHSEKTVHFAKDGRSMTYEWEGSITNQQIKPDDPLRKGFAGLGLSQTDDSGNGRVDHVAVDVILEFDFYRVTEDWLARNKLDHYKPVDLSYAPARAKFAVELAAIRKSMS